MKTFTDHLGFDNIYFNRYVYIYFKLYIKNQI
jgi:hypothetical protein